jgi:hypothetical protein
MPVIYPPKLTQIYGNTFYFPSSIVNTTPASTTVLSSDGNGATFYQNIQSQFFSTVAGLGSAGYVSSTQLTSTTTNLLSRIPIFNFGQGQTDGAGDTTITFDRVFTSTPGITVSPILVNTGYQSTIFVTSSLTTSNTHILSYDIFKSTLVGFKDYSYVALGI